MKRGAWFGGVVAAVMLATLCGCTLSCEVSTPVPADAPVEAAAAPEYASAGADVPAVVPDAAPAESSGSVAEVTVSAPTPSVEPVAALPQAEASAPVHVKVNVYNHDATDHRERGAFRGGPGVWRVFATLSDAERSRMFELQRTDPDAYHAVIVAKLDQLRREEADRRQEFRQLADRYRETPDEATRQTIKSQLTQMVKADFQRRLAENRLQFEYARRQAERLEKALEKRAANADAIVDSQVELMLQGEFPPENGRKSRGDRPPELLKPHRGPWLPPPGPDKAL